MSPRIHYIVYTVVPLNDEYLQYASKTHWVIPLKSEVPHTYKYKFFIPPTTITHLIKPSSVDCDEPYLIVCSRRLYGHNTSSAFIKGETKYIYNARYPITTTKQPYRQLKEHIAQYLIDKLIKSL